MSAPRFFIDAPPSPAEGAQCALSAEDGHHAARVLRLAVGDAVHAIERGTGRAFEATVASIGSEVLLKIHREQSSLPLKECVHTLFLPLIKGDRMEWAIEKATELGVASLLIWQAQRSVARLSADRANKVTRWKKIVEAASKQSARRTVPQIAIAASLTEALDSHHMLCGHEDRIFCCSLSGDPRTPREIPPFSGSAHVIVGPEGDFSPEEESELRERGVIALSLGQTILRAETAAVAAIAMLNGVFGPRADTHR